jgi:diaminopimelate epimerase
MKVLKFSKMQAAGNDFILIKGDRASRAARLAPLVVRMCDRRFGVGADGVLLLEKSRKADVRMRVINADGSEAEMCGNGARCCALYVSQADKKKSLTIETLAGLLEARITGVSVKLKMTDPVDLKLDMRIVSEGRVYEVDYMDTGVPHAVIEVGDIGDAPVKKLGAFIRRHDSFSPAGTNVDFVHVAGRDHIEVRTYERGVEDETLACGTGAVASAIIATLNHVYKSGRTDRSASHRIFVRTRSGEELKVYFRLLKKRITDVWLEGRAKLVFKGEYHV